MLEAYLEKYIEDLYEKQNKGASIEQQGLYTKSDYYKLLKPVLELVSNHYDYSLEELRDLLYEQSNIEDSIRDFVYNKKMTPGMVLSYGTMNYKETIVVGNRKEAKMQNGICIEDERKMTEDTIIDLASVTKIIVCVGILKLVQLRMLDLNDEIVRYEPRFTQLKGVTILDLLSFHVPVRTNGRIDGVNNFKEAEEIVFTMSKDENFKYGMHPYTDMGVIALRYVVEKVTGMDLYSFIDQNILRKANMTDTYALVPPSKIEKVASTTLETKIMNDGNVINAYGKEGTLHDTKARILGAEKGLLAGHAGLFSTAKDMTNFSKAIIKRQLIDEKMIEMIGKNRTGEKYVQDGKEKYIQYLGLLCYSKNPILEDSELFHAMSGKSFASAGFTGTQLTVDPVNELYLFLGSNRVHNRVSFIAPSQREKIKYDDKGKATIILPNGEEKITSYRFAWDRDKVVTHKALNLTLQYKLLEDIYHVLAHEKIEKKENVKTIKKGR